MNDSVPKGRKSGVRVVRNSHETNAFRESDNWIPGVVWHGRTVRAVVFDLDGTLTDSIEVYYEVFQEAAVRVGIHVKRKDILEPLAEGKEPWSRALCAEFPDRAQKIREFRQEMRPRFVEALKRVRPLPGVEEMLRLLVEREITLGVLTDASADSLQCLHTHSLIHYFAAVVTRDDGFPRKPEPTGLLECVERMEADPSHTVIVGDTLMDIRVGKEVGALTVGVLSGLATRRQLEHAEPTALVDDVTHVPALWGLK